MLNDYRGDFLRIVSDSVSTFVLNFLRGSLSFGKFPFEDTNAILIKREKYDLLSLLELCKITDGQVASDV